jgi:hypothetical protein
MRALEVMQLVLGESCRYLLTALLVAMFTCATATAQTPHVRLESGSVHASKIEAIRDDKKISLQFRSIRVQTDFPGATSGKCAVQMIYEPASKLFEWRSFQTYEGYDAELEAKQFANNSFVYLAPDRLVAFLLFPSQVAVWESTEHYDSMDRGQESVLRFFEEHRATADALRNTRSKTVDLMKEIPRSFMEQCYNAMQMLPRIEESRRHGNQWIFRITGPNGNSAEVSLDDAFEVVATKLIPRPAVIVENSASVPTAVHAMRGGISSRLEARELLLNIAHGCSLASEERVLMVYDPTTKLFLSFPEEPFANWLSGKDRLPDDMATQFIKNSMFVITEDKIVAFSTDTETVRQSGARLANLQDAQQSLLSEIAKPQSAPAAEVKRLPLDSLLVPMQYDVPKRIPPALRSVTYEGGRWRLQLQWSAGPLKEAALFLDDSFNPVKADLTYAATPARNGNPANWTLLPDAMRSLKADQLATPPQIEFKMTSKSSSIHALKNGQPVSVQAYLIDVGYTDLNHPLMGRMLAVYEPTSRIFWCIYEREDPTWGESILYYSSQLEKGNSWLLVTDEKVLGFDAVSNNSFTGVQESTLRYASFSEGLNYALTAIWRNAGLIRDGHVYFDLLLPQAFLTQRTGPYNVAPRYLGISESRHNWQLVLEGASGQQAIVTLGEGYEPARASFTYAAPAQK